MKSIKKIMLAGSLLAGITQCNAMELPKRPLVKGAEHAALFTTLAQQAQKILSDEKDGKKRLIEALPIKIQKKPFQCDQCDYSAARSCHLKDHMLTHSNEKPFQCDQCDYSCVTKSALKLHIRTHTGERPFRCDQCDYAAARGDSLASHMRIHTSAKPFKCDECAYCTAYRQALVQHKKRIHSEKMEN